MKKAKYEIIKSEVCSEILAIDKPKARKRYIRRSIDAGRKSVSINGSGEDLSIQYPLRTDVSISNPLQTITAVQQRHPSYSIFNPTNQSIKETFKINPPFLYPSQPGD